MLNGHVSGYRNKIYFKISPIILICSLNATRRGMHLGIQFCVDPLLIVFYLNLNSRQHWSRKYRKYVLNQWRKYHETMIGAVSLMYDLTLFLIIWINQELQYNHNKTKHSKPEHMYHGMYSGFLLFFIRIDSQSSVLLRLSQIALWLSLASYKYCSADGNDSRFTMNTLFYSLLCRLNRIF